MTAKRILALAAAVPLMAGLAGAANAAPAQTPAEILQAGAQAGLKDGYPAVIGMVRDGDNTQYIQAGAADRVKGTPADPKMKFRIGSNTKAFTATVLLQLEAEHKLSLDDTVDHWLPGAVHANGNDGTKITLRQLLTHTSGIPDYAGNAQFDLNYVGNLDPSLQWAPQTLVNLGTASKPVAAPGAKYSYSSTNYVLAGMVIKAVTGNDPAAEIQHRIIEPLGLHDTTFPTSDPAMPANSLNGYFLALGVYRDVTASQVQAFGSAGAIVSTLDDLATFERALMTGKLLQPAQEQELKTTVPMDATSGNGYGLGIGHAQTPCGPVWTHTGAVLGYLSQWITSDDGSKQMVYAVNEFHMIEGTPGQTDVGTAALNAYCAL
ncbi:serine hydrolase domain-containing protein [Amycolatopsis saalfeldensis]|uniref:serine hydrolase domain-containing protein n=1 Tax=Amycolatopsis saalfeldensis TaxID=394193 RepID=UPI001160787B|nr:serine hydrolase domain-containing protein [Amycolatopsis saalfeldensis]